MNPGPHTRQRVRMCGVQRNQPLTEGEGPETMRVKVMWRETVVYEQDFFMPHIPDDDSELQNLMTGNRAGEVSVHTQDVAIIEAKEVA